VKNQVVIAFGSNIQPEKNIEAAKSRIEQFHRILKVSSVKKTPPLGDIPQPDYSNGAFLIETALSQKDLKTWLKSLEDKLGRDRTAPKFGPRTMDLDIVVFNGKIVDPDFFEREFLREIVRELLPDLLPNRRTYPA
jgi:2-amino-4-hydroxy-6-hydroxymethyldihydropteridine diphosphokinase